MKKELIKSKLDEYLEFNSDELFNRNDFCVIFGGAIRDIVSGGKVENIKDIDVMGLSQSLKVMTIVLEMHGYKLVDLVKPDVYDMYKGIECIFKPKTYINKNDKIVQLIRPYTGLHWKFNDHVEGFYNLLSKVDLTSSGLFYDGNDLYESLPDSYVHCKLKIFEKIPTATMYETTRTMLRANGLEVKGWKQIDRINKTLLERTMKILKIKHFKIKSLEDYALTKEKKKKKKWIY